MLKADVTSLPTIWQRIRQLAVHGKRLCLLHQDRLKRKAMVPLPRVSDDWSINTTKTANRLVSPDTLRTSARDPHSSAERWPRRVGRQQLSMHGVARDSAYAAWNELTDPNAFQPDLPLAFRDAYTFVPQRGGYLEGVPRLNSRTDFSAFHRRRCRAKCEVR